MADNNQNKISCPIKFMDCSQVNKIYHFHFQYSKKIIDGQAFYQ